MKKLLFLLPLFLTACGKEAQKSPFIANEVSTSSAISDYKILTREEHPELSIIHKDYKAYPLVVGKIKDKKTGKIYLVAFHSVSETTIVKLDEWTEEPE